MGLYSEYEYPFGEIDSDMGRGFIELIRTFHMFHNPNNNNNNDNIQNVRLVLFIETISNHFHNQFQYSMRKGYMRTELL